MTFAGMDGFHTHDADPVAAHLVGYRSWGVDERGDTAPGRRVIHGGRRPAEPIEPRIRGGLVGITHSGFVWNDGVNQADCGSSVMFTQSERWHKIHARGVPAQECGCGFWAYNQHRPSVHVMQGVIHGWGRMIAGPKGFRCQFARIVALCPGPPHLAGFDGGLIDQRREAVAVCYPSAQLFDSLDDMWETYPATDLSAVVPPEPPAPPAPPPPLGVW